MGRLNWTKVGLKGLRAAGDAGRVGAFELD